MRTFRPCHGGKGLSLRTNRLLRASESVHHVTFERACPLTEMRPKPRSHHRPLLTVCLPPTPSRSSALVAIGSVKAWRCHLTTHARRQQALHGTRHFQYPSQRADWDDYVPTQANGLTRPWAIPELDQPVMPVVFGSGRKPPSGWRRLEVPEETKVKLCGSGPKAPTGTSSPSRSAETSAKQLGLLA